MSKFLCKIFGHSGWPESLVELIEPVWGGPEAREEHLAKLDRPCNRCGLRPSDLTSISK